LIRLRLYGGLGNQIFQLGAALAVAEVAKLNAIRIDLSSLASYSTNHGYHLERILDLSMAKLEFSYGPSRILSWRLPRVLSFGFFSRFFLNDSNFSLESAENWNRNLFMDGYFQQSLSGGNFKEIRQIIRHLMRSEVISEIGRVDFDLAMHLRGGDFISLNRNPKLDQEFYTRALSLFEPIDRRKIVVISDDPDYAYQQFPDLVRNAHMQCSDPVTDFITLAGSRNRILAPSTFSFWASALGKNDAGSQVVAWPFWHGNERRNISLPNENLAATEYLLVHD